MCDVLNQHCGRSKIPDRINIYSLNDRSLGRVLLGHKQMLYAVLSRRKRDRQHAAYRSYSSVERQFTDAHSTRHIFNAAEIAVRTKYPQRNRQVETRTFLPHIRRSKIYRQFMDREKIAAVIDRRTNAFSAFAYRRIRQPHNDQVRRRVVVTRRGPHVDLNVHDVGVNAVNGSRLRLEEHNSKVFREKLEPP